MPARIRLRINQFQKFAALKGHKTDDAKAKAIGVNPSTLSRVLKGTQRVGSDFIAGALRAFPEVEFEDLFEVYDDEVEAA